MILSSCTVARKTPKGKPFLYKNNIEVKGANLSVKEKSDLKTKLATQIDDSARIIKKDYIFVYHTIKHPPVFDTNLVKSSIQNMKGALIHYGYYSPKIDYATDTISKLFIREGIVVNYQVFPGIPTVIDTVTYKFENQDLDNLAIKTKSEALLIKNQNISKSNVLGETNRLVDLYRNNGYYKFSTDNIKVLGDTTIESLTNISDDPFENLKLLTEAKEKEKKPTINIALTLNPDLDTNTIKKFFINNIYIYPDYSTIDTGKNSTFTEVIDNDFIIRYHNKLFKNSFLIKNLSLKKGSVYKQENFTRTINKFSKTDVWQSVNIQLIEVKDQPGKLDVIIQLVPTKKFGFEANIGMNYSTNSSYSLGNLVGFTGNLSLQNRNVGKEAIKMTNAFQTGVELNVSKNNQYNGIINSNDVGYSNTITIPKLVTPFEKINQQRFYTQQTFLKTSVSYTDRFDLFKLQSYNFAFGYEWSKKKNRTNTLKLLNLEFTYLYNRSSSFDSTLVANPFLKYSYNTALVLGTSYSYSSIHYNSKSRWQRSFKMNIEESGIPWSNLNIFTNYLRKFTKTDMEISWTKTYPRSSHVFHLFGGVGIPLDKKDSSLPFFKQYFEGGSNSMRGWPVRGIGQGARPLAAYDTVVFNDRTADVRLEANYEYRYNIAQIIPNTLMLRGAMFMDVGNIWNLRKTTAEGVADSLQFNLNTLYKELGVAVGTGFRFDFNYFLIRFDLGFRLKRPDIPADNGWQVPNITFNNLFKRGEVILDPITNTRANDDRYRKWRYENFNFTIGISYPF